MIAKLSPLKFESFYITNIRYDFDFEPEDDSSNIDESAYEIDIDYVLNNSESNKFAMYIKLEVNFGKNRLPGHSISVAAGGLFSLSADLNLTDDTAKNLKTLSPLTMIISSLRGFIKQLTSNGPVGGYLLPSIDVYDLLQKKTEKKRRSPRKKSSEASI